MEIIYKSAGVLPKHLVYIHLHIFGGKMGGGGAGTKFAVR